MAKRKKPATKKSSKSGRGRGSSLGEAMRSSAKKSAAKRARTSRSKSTSRPKLSVAQRARQKSVPCVVVCECCGRLGPKMPTLTDAFDAALAGGFIVTKKGFACPNCASLSLELK